MSQDLGTKGPCKVGMQMESAGDQKQTKRTSDSTRQGRDGASQWVGLSKAEAEQVLAGKADVLKLSKAIAATWEKMCDTSSPIYGPSKKVVILLLSGALNPVHSGHVQMMLEAGAALEARPESDTAFAAGVLSGSSHSYVYGKLGTAAITEPMRNILAAQAAAPHATISTAPYGCASGSHVCARLETVLKEFNGAGKKPKAAVQIATTAVGGNGGEGPADEEPAKNPTEPSSSFVVPSDFPWKQLRVMPVYGSDFYTKYPSTSAKPRVIVTRVDTEGSAAKAKKQLASQLEDPRSIVHPDFILLDPLQPIPDFSSTKVRQSLRVLGEKGEARAQEELEYLKVALGDEVLHSMRTTPESQLYCGRRH